MNFDQSEQIEIIDTPTEKIIEKPVYANKSSFWPGFFN